MRGASHARKLVILSLMVATVIAVVAYGTAVAANLAHGGLNDPENPNPSPSPSVVFPVTVHVVGTGDGHVVIQHTSCGGTCKTEVDAGSVVSLLAKPAAGSVFVRWGGACHGHTGCRVKVTQARSVSATFARGAHLGVSRTGQGRVTSRRISCPGDCGDMYALGSTVHLFHHAAAGWHFASWHGACAGRGGCVVHVHGPRSVHATFARNRR